MSNFFVVPGNRQAFWAMPDILILNILSISCNITGTAEADNYANCSMNTSATHNAGSWKQYTNTWADTSEPERSCTNTNSKSKKPLYKNRQYFKFE